MPPTSSVNEKIYEIAEKVGRMDERLDAFLKRQEGHGDDIAALRKDVDEIRLNQKSVKWLVGGFVSAWGMISVFAVPFVRQKLGF